MYEGTNLSELKSGLDQLFTALQNAVSNQVFSNSLPLVGNSLKNSSNDAVQFISKLKSAFDSELDQLASTKLPSELTPDDLKQALDRAASSLGVLKGIQSDYSTPAYIRPAAGHRHTNGWVRSRYLLAGRCTEHLLRP